jgi:uncharacterized protein YlxW (UPF0749 family)
MSTPTSERSVLEDFLQQAIADDYPDVAPTRDTRPWYRRHWLALPALVLIGVISATAVISTRASDEARQATRAALGERITALSEVVAGTQADVDGQRQAVYALQAGVLEGVVDAVQEEIEALEAAAGAVQLAGPGLTVTIDDAPDAAAGSLNQVLDRDLQDIVNALWQMGAAGIAVNDQRLTGATAIRGAGEAILVNYQPITRPYVITAVGTTTTGGEDSGLRQLLDLLSRDYGLVSEVTTGDVALPAGEVRTPRFAVPAVDAAAAPGEEVGG